MSAQHDELCAVCNHPRRFHFLNTPQGERLGLFAEACAGAACGCQFFTPESMRADPSALRAAQPGAKP